MYMHSVAARSIFMSATTLVRLYGAGPRSPCRHRESVIRSDAPRLSVCTPALGSRSPCTPLCLVACLGLPPLPFFRPGSFFWSLVPFFGLRPR